MVTLPFPSLKLYVERSNRAPTKWLLLAPQTGRYGVVVISVERSNLRTYKPASYHSERSKRKVMPGRNDVKSAGPVPGACHPAGRAEWRAPDRARPRPSPPGAALGRLPGPRPDPRTEGGQG